MADELCDILWNMENLFEPRHDPAIRELDPADYQNALSRPGEFPYTRGIHPDMYSKGNLPTVRKYGGFGSGRELNRYLAEQLASGVTGLSIAYDLPTQMGYDPDHVLAQGEVGLTGVSISNLGDYEDVFRGILPEIAAKGIGVSKTINATAPILLALHVAAAKKQGVDPKLLRGTIQNDVLKEYLARNTFIYPLAGTLRLVRDVFAWSKENLPKFNTISICGYHMREKGATAAQELAYMFSNAVQYVVTALSAGQSVDDFAPQLSFFINVKKNLLEEVAKLRAARRIWAQIMKEGFGAKSERSWKLRMQSYTGGSDLRAEKPQINIVRDAVRTLAAVCGGPQGTNTTSYDEAITIPTPLSQQVAIDLPYIILLEKELAKVIDPMGGAYYLEHLTNHLEAEAWKELGSISRLASYQEALSWMSRNIEAQAYREQREEDSGARKVIGKNINSEGSELYPPVEIFAPPGSPVKRQEERCESIRKWRLSRDTQAAMSALDRLKKAAQNSPENLMPLLIESVESRATLGEISDALRQIFGSADALTPWEPSAPVEVFNESLRVFIQQKTVLPSDSSQTVFLTPKDLPYVKKVNTPRLEQPGEFPYTRGIARRYEPCQLMPLSKKRPSSMPGRLLADGWPLAEKGAGASQELADVIHEGLLSLQSAPGSAGPCVGLSLGNSFFVDIAKCRAARRLWAKLAREKLDVQPDADILKLHIYGKTSAASLVKPKPYNNIARSALQALEGLLGGVQYLEIFPFDWPYRSQAQSTEWSTWAAQLIKDTDALLKYEIGLEGLIDPLAGSFFLEALTDRLEAEALAFLKKMNGLELAAAQKFIQQELAVFLTIKERVPVVGVDVQTQGPSPEPMQKQKL